MRLHNLHKVEVERYIILSYFYSLTSVAPIFFRRESIVTNEERTIFNQVQKGII